MMNVFVGAVVFLAIILAVRSVYKDSRSGSCSGCGCGCNSCNGCAQKTNKN